MSLSMSLPQVHKVFHSGVAAQEGSIREGDQVLSINGTAFQNYAHWEALRVLRRAKSREMAVVVLRRGGLDDASKTGVPTCNQAPTQSELTETGETSNFTSALKRHQSQHLQEFKMRSVFFHSLGQQLCVRLEKNNRDLGFSLEGGVGSSLGNRPLTVQKIFQGEDRSSNGCSLLQIIGGQIK